MDALGTPFSCIIGLVDSLGIIIFYSSLGICKLGPIFNDNLFLPWLNDSLVGNSIVLKRESLSSLSNSMAFHLIMNLLSMHGSHVRANVCA
jgi:hypothetical protein